MNFSAPVFVGAPEFLTLGFTLIAIGILVALLILWFGVRAAAKRRATRDELEARGEVSYVSDAARVAPPIAAVPAPRADAPEPAPPPAPAPEPVAPEPLADEPIAAAAPMDASPATMAADLTAQRAPEAPVPAPPAESAAAAAAPDDLTRMKGVGPRLAERLNNAGITSFARLAALTPEEAEALDARLGDFRGRIHRDRWIEQARLLAAGDTAGYEATFGKL